MTTNWETSPRCPSAMDWSPYYPAFYSQDNHLSSDAQSAGRNLMKEVEVADIGCGFGGLLIALGPRLPETLPETLILGPRTTSSSSCN
jgi:tRNA (guanine-N7-)-methyltransferase